MIKALKPLLLALALCPLAPLHAADGLGIFIIDGPASGFRQSYRLNIAGGTFTDASLFYYQDFVERYYSPDFEAIDGIGGLLDYECFAGEGGCDGLVRNFVARPGYIAWSAYSPRSTDDCVLGERPYEICGVGYSPSQMVVLPLGEASGTPAITLTSSVITAVPEPAAWASMIAGFGLTGAALRRRGALTLARSIRQA